MHTWELWYPRAAATGLLFARGRLDPTAVLWVHAAPDVLAVTVRDETDRPVAQGNSLVRQGDEFPMTRLALQENRLVREDRWPQSTDLGSLVILHGGEVGRLLSWWNAPDGSSWRWQLEFFNHR
jgi:hypothetical protein